MNFYYKSINYKLNSFFVCFLLHFHMTIFLILFKVPLCISLGNTTSTLHYLHVTNNFEHAFKTMDFFLCCDLCYCSFTFSCLLPLNPCPCRAMPRRVLPRVVRVTRTRGKTKTGETEGGERRGNILTITCWEMGVTQGQ